MKIKTKAKIGVDITMAVAFLFNIFTGLAIFFGIIAGGGSQYRGGRGSGIQSIADLGTKSWYKLIHDWSGILIIILIAAHIILNWRTIMCYFRSIYKSGKIAKANQVCENI
jgi:hypothetical protein